MKVASGDEFPDDEGNPFLSLKQLLEIGWSVAQVATVIETHGVYGLDRYGRYVKFDPKSKEVDRCLDLLAAEFDIRMSGFGIGDMPDSRLATYGWAARVLPAEQEPDSIGLFNVAASELKVTRSAFLLISSLRNAQKIDHDRNAAAAVQRLTERNGTPVNLETIRELLKTAEEVANRRRS